MHLIVEEIEGPYYMDIILSADEIEEMKLGKMIDTKACIHAKTFYVGVRSGDYDEEEIRWKDED